jgi:hypothetical protein
MAARLAHPTRSRGLRCGIVWHKWGDLRVADHEPLTQAHSENDTVLHLFVFDPVWFAATRILGIPRTGVHRARFMLEAVADLRRVRCCARMTCRVSATAVTSVGLVRVAGRTTCCARRASSFPAGHVVA